MLYEKITKLELTFDQTNWLTDSQNLSTAKSSNSTLKWNPPNTEIIIVWNKTKHACLGDPGENITAFSEMGFAET